MENTIMTGDQIFGNRLAYVRAIRSGMTSLFSIIRTTRSRSLSSASSDCRRETVTIRDGKVYINDSTEPLRDDFCPETPVGDFGPYEVPRAATLCSATTGTYQRIPATG